DRRLVELDAGAAGGQCHQQRHGSRALDKGTGESGGQGRGDASSGHGSAREGGAEGKVVCHVAPARGRRGQIHFRKGPQSGSRISPCTLASRVLTRPSSVVVIRASPRSRVA